MDCVLCEVRNREGYRIIYDDDLFFIVFNNVPVSELHLMILPVRHVENWHELTDEESTHLMFLFDHCQQFLEKESGLGVNIMINSWLYRSQEHLHAHLIPNEYGVGGMAEPRNHRPLADEKAQEKLANGLRERFLKK